MARPGRLPNIVVILSDDQGCWALGCAGNPEIRTPNLDALARRGVRFENFFCASPVCSPARASLLTGRIPSSHGIHDWLRGGNMNREDDRAIEYLRGIPGYTDLLAQAGYVCGLSGKWHLGDSLRPQKSFSYWYVHQTGGSSYHHAPMIRNGVPYCEPGYLTDAITDGALEFLEQQRGKKSPYYLSVHFTAPHSPWVGEHPPHIVDSYADCPFKSCPDLPAHPWQTASAPRGSGPERREILKGYFAAVTAMDANIGRIVQWLDEAGQREDTVIFFLSDNGMNMGHHGIFGKGNGTFPLNMVEESVKVPAILCAPGRCKEGAVEHGLFCQADFLPTLCEYLELPLPEPQKLPGQSFAPLLRGQGMPGRDEVVVYDEYGPVRMVRDREWKYVHRYPYGPHELYRLTEDPAEEHNLVADLAARPVVETMKARLDRFFVTYADPARDGVREPVRGSGQLGWAGLAAEGRTAYAGPLPYVDAAGHPREENYQPPSW